MRPRLDFRESQGRVGRRAAHQFAALGRRQLVDRPQRVTASGQELVNAFDSSGRI